jgi:hypothetical protein
MDFFYFYFIIIIIMFRGCVCVYNHADFNCLFKIKQGCSLLW